MSAVKIVIIVTIVSFSISLAKASEIQFITHNIEGQTYKDENGELRGKKSAGRRAFNLELVREMMILLNYPRKFKSAPFKRGLFYVQNEENYAFFNVTRNSNREKTVKWVGPLQSDKSYFYELKAAPTGIQTLDDAKKVKQICALNGGVHETFLQKNGFENLIGNVSYTSCFQMLALQRINLTMTSVSTLAERLKDADISPHEIKQTPVLIFETEGYLAFSKNISDDTIQQWQNALEQLKQSGKYSLLSQEYLFVQ